MPYRQLPNRTADSPLRHWLRANLPDEPPFPAGRLSWEIVRRYAAGELPRDLAKDADLTPIAIEGRVRHLATKLGYQPGTDTAWLRSNGTLADHAVRYDAATGCLVWAGHLAPSENGPRATLPAPFRSTADGEPQTAGVRVRRWLWERAHGSLPRGLHVRAICGNRACVALAHAEVSAKAASVTLTLRRSLIDRKHEETVEEAAERLGIDTRTVERYRGAGGKRGPHKPRRSALRRWLTDHLPAQQPAAVDELDWLVARRYAAGVTLQTIATEQGVSRQMVHLRVRRVATALGWSAEDGDVTP